MVKVSGAWPSTQCPAVRTHCLPTTAPPHIAIFPSLERASTRTKLGQLAMLADSPSMMRRSPPVRGLPVDGEPGACAHLCGPSTTVLDGDGSPWFAANAGEAVVSASAKRLVEGRRTQPPPGLLSRRTKSRL